MPDDFRVWTSSWYDWHTWHQSDVVGLTIRHTFSRVNFFGSLCYVGISSVLPKVSEVVLIYSAITSYLSDQWKSRLWRIFSETARLTEIS